MSSLNLPYYRIVAIITYVTYCSVLVLLHLFPIDLHLTAHHACLSKRGKGCKLCHSMSNTNFITNIQSGETCFTSGGKCNTGDTIYAAEFTKHKLIYVRHSSQKLSSRFNGHPSDVNVKPKSYKLAHHFHGNKECNIKRDLIVYILQDNVTGLRDKREYFEDPWIMRLDTKAPHGMNTDLKHFAKIHYELFD